MGFPIIKIMGNGKIIIDKHILAVSGALHSVLGINRKCKFVVYPNAELHFKGVASMSNTVIIASHKVEIGDNVMIGGGCTIVDTDFHSLDYSLWNTPQDEVMMKRNDVVIGNNVFLGMNSIVLKGCHIGDGAIIGAGSVVCKNIPAGEIWGGNPIKFIRSRD